MSGGGKKSIKDSYAAAKAAEDARRAQARSAIARIFGIDTGAAPAVARAPVGIKQMGYVPQKTAAQPATDPEVEANRKARLANYDRVRQDVTRYHRQRLDERMGDVAKSLKQALLRSGMYGGSGQVDREAELRRQYSEGLMDIENLADRTASGLEAADTQTYNNLIASINAGMESGDAARAAANQMNTGAQRALQEAQGVSFANLFDKLSQDLATRAYMRGQQRGQQREAPVIVTPGYGPGGATKGRITRGL